MMLEFVKNSFYDLTKGLKAMFYRYSGDVSFNEKDCILVKATVADHRVYKDEPETYLNRVKVLKNVGSK